MALSGIECPAMQSEGDNPKEAKEKWRRFKQHVEQMFKGPLKCRIDEEKFSYLLTWIGQKEGISTNVARHLRR